ncbi:MAG: L,D-transpeptidase family protein [Ilumatobacteraceae bacterium]
MPAILAIGALAVVVFAGTLGGEQDTGDASGPETTLQGESGAAAIDATSTTDIYGVSGLTVPVSTTPVTSTTVIGVNKTTLDRPLLSGTFGNDVKALQTRLTELGFAPGVADGAFGDQTRQAVWAYEKLVLNVPRAEATGKVTNEIWQGMQDRFAIQPRRQGGGTHVEIYLPEQVAAVFTDNVATLVVHISSGDDQEWCQTITIDTDANGNKLDPPTEKAVCGVSKTPGGVFRFTRQVVGDRVGALGRMFNPVYFNYGIAMHGAVNVPLQPVSHGCIRMHKTISETFQSFVHLRDLVYVWGQDGKEPEAYSKNERLPIFDYPDPTATTTTTSTTTTLPATTTTAKAATTTTAPAATTTTAKPSNDTTTTVATTTAPATTAPATTAVATTTTTPTTLFP